MVVRYREPAGKTKQEAKEYEARRLLEIKNQPQPLIELTLGQLAAEFLESYSKPNKSSYIQDKIRARRLLEFFGDRKVKNFNRRMAELYKSWRLQEAKPATVNREIACLKTMFSYAIKQGYIQYNPLAKLSLLREDNKRLHYLTIDEIESLLSVVDKEYLRVIIIAALGTRIRKI